MPRKRITKNLVKNVTFDTQINNEEKKILGSILIDPLKYAQVIQHYPCFDSSLHNKIFKTIKKFIELDGILNSEALINQIKDEIGYVDYLIELESTFEFGILNSAIRKAKEAKAWRNLADLGYEIYDKSEKGIDPSKIIDEIITKTKEIKLSCHEKEEEIIPNENIISLETLLKKEFIPPKFYIEPFLHEGSTVLIYAQKGIGKTWLGLLIALSVTGKINAFQIGNWIVNHNTGVLLIDGEETEYILQDRLQRLINFDREENPLSNKNSFPLSIITSHQLVETSYKAINLLNPSYRDRITQILKDNPSYKLLILDNMSVLAMGRDEFSTIEWGPINNFFLNLRFMGVSVIFFAHGGKDIDRGPRGTSGIDDNTTCSIKLRRPQKYKAEDQAKFIIEFDKPPRQHPKNGGNFSKFLIAFEKDGEDKERWTVDTVLPGAQRDKIIYLILKGIKQIDIADNIKVDKSRISHVKKYAINQGLIEKDGKVTIKGNNWLENHSEV